LRSAIAAAAVAAVATLSTGCDIRSFIDPSEMFSNTKKTIQKPILGTISTIDPGIDDPEDTFYQATEVKPSDLLAISQDYRIGKGDLVNISVTDLVGIGVETNKQARVSESGNISMPLLGQVHAEGMTEIELEKAIVEAYRNGNILTNAQVMVQVVEARARTFSALGAVNSPGQYAILKSDFRLLDALVLTRDVLQTVDTIYVIRQVSEDPKPGASAAGPTPKGSDAPGAAAPSLPAPDPLAPPHGVMSLDTGGTSGGAAGGVPAPTVMPITAPATRPSSGSGFAFNAPTPPAETRTIKIPLDALRNGDLRYNIVVRPQDLIIAPNPVIGEYYMGGHVARGGVYSLAARKITLKQAIVSAGMLDPLAIPQRTELIRRIGSSREAFVRVDLNAIFDGTQPDLYLKPYDVIDVGTNCLAPFIQDLRTGFRITYGFGFLYDRNFAPAQQNSG
jgi:polysaccharide export outer membrane protein